MMKGLPQQLRLYAVTDSRRLRGRTLLDTVAAALDGGATFVQLREKELSPAALLEEARACRAHTVWFTQEGDAGEAEETCYYGTAQSKNMGYYSLLLLEQVMSAMLYRSDDA